jgi:hypothetical protein
MFPVHVSASFLQPPTLSASLYLLLLRFLHRDYTEVAQLTAAISTDAALTSDETQVRRVRLSDAVTFIRERLDWILNKADF